MKSDFGRSVIALRDNEPYAISRGVALWKVRLLTFMASAVFPGGLMGALTLAAGRRPAKPKEEAPREA